MGIMTRVSIMYLWYGLRAMFCVMCCVGACLCSARYHAFLQHATAAVMRGVGVVTMIVRCGRWLCRWG
jgi:hypothetical protein